MGFDPGTTNADAGPYGGDPERRRVRRARLATRAAGRRTVTDPSHATHPPERIGAFIIFGETGRAAAAFTATLPLGPEPSSRASRAHLASRTGLDPPQEISMTQDSKLQEAVLAAFDWEPGISAGQIGVSANAGVVSLSGYVDSYAE